MNRVIVFLVLAIGSAPAWATDIHVAAQQIDALLAQDWQKHSLEGNPPASDEIFVRRVHLDLVGRIPTHEETVSFLHDTQTDKRAQLIDRLLASEGYTMHQFHFYADLLRVLSKGTYNGDAGRVTGMSYVEFIKDSVRSNKPYDQLVRELVSAQGKAWENGAVGYYQRDRGMPLDNLALATRIFLGTRIECAQCHNHPFDQWTQMQFHQMAAYTYGVQTTFGIYSPAFNGMFALQRKRREQAGRSPDDEVHLRQAINEMIVPIKHAYVSHRPQQLRLPHDYSYQDAKPKSVVKAATLFGAPAEFSLKTSPLESFAAWLTSPENPRFTTVVANRWWKKLFGLGLIEPVDELTDSTLAVNPPLMEHLRRLMIAQRYDVKAFLRVLCNTQAYQREVTRKELAAGEVSHFTGPLLRRMSAEQMWDSFTTLINTAPDLPNLPLREASDVFLTSSRKLGEALEHLTPEELLQSADVTSEVFRAHAAQFKVLQQQIADARKREDKAAVSVLARELGTLRQAEIKTADENIHTPAVLKLSKQSRQAGVGYQKIEVPGYMPKDFRAEQDAQRQFFLEESKRFGIPASKQDVYVKHRQDMMRVWPRAAEIDSPAPIGHALREFGQSDRDAVENANHDASVPQALVMMNGPMLPNILNVWSQLRLVVKQARYPDDQVEAVYVTLFSRKPTTDEKARWSKSQADGGVNQIEDLIYALLNTQQFIFIQ
jgi:uncharacterized protein DUF1549/uncharacterized protein DUF1553